jgi:tetratricopeptide (TPR) repeat protein
MIRAWFIAAFLVVSHSAAIAGEFKVGDRVFWKTDARASDGVQEISIARFAFPSTVRDVQNDFLFLGAGWIKQEDALSVDEALDYFSEQIKEHPEEPVFWNNRGRVWDEKKDHDKAIADYTKAAELLPGDPTTHNNLGTAYQHKGDHAEAIKHFDAALKADPTDATVYYNRGRSNQYSGNFSAAAKDYADSIRVDPNFLPGYNNAAWLAATCPEEQYRDAKMALDYAQRAAEMTQGKVWEVLDTLAAAQAENGDFAAAVKTSEQAIEVGDDAAIHGGVRDRMTLYQEGKPYRMPVDDTIAD